MRRKISFLVIGESAAQSHGRDITVAGRCLDGPILIGDHFRQIQDRGKAGSIDLIVEEISAYGKLLSQLDSVVTGNLILSGRLSRPLTDHTVIVGDEAEQ